MSLQLFLNNQRRSQTGNSPATNAAASSSTASVSEPAAALRLCTAAFGLVATRQALPDASSYGSTLNSKCVWSPSTVASSGVVDASPYSFGTASFPSR